jgi:hypothetical protein
MPAERGRGAGAEVGGAGGRLTVPFEPNLFSGQNILARFDVSLNLGPIQHFLLTCASTR